MAHARIFLFVLLLIPIVAPGARAEMCARHENFGRPTIGLALGGGGARGAAHIGVLKVLEERQIPVDFIAGTSMGAVVGGLFASGMTATEVESFLLATEWNRLFNDATRRQDKTLRRKSDDDLGLFGPRVGVGADSSLLPGGAIAGQKISVLLERTLGPRMNGPRFDNLPIPFAAVATDLATGKMVELRQGSLAQAIRASMSVPGAFDPVRWGPHLLVDGGIVRNLPVDVVRNMGADIVIAVNVEYPLLTADELDGVVEVVNQLTTLMVAGNTRRQIEAMKPVDLLIDPGLDSQFGSADFKRAPEAIVSGYQAATAVLANHAHLSPGPESFTSWRQTLSACAGESPRIDFVEIENRSRFSDEVIRGFVSGAPNAPLDGEKRDREMSQIHALGFIRSATWEVVERGRETGLLVRVEPDQRGGDFIESGLELTGDSRGTNIDLKVGYLKTDVDDRGSEFRAVVQVGNEQGLFTELYMPLDDRLRWIFQPSISATRDNFTTFDINGNALAEWELDEYAGKLSIGREFGRHAGLFLGMTRYAGNADITTGSPNSENLRYSGGEWRVDAIYDRLDNRYLPSVGSFGRLSYIRSTGALGADADFDQLELSLFSAVTRGRHTAWFGTRFNTTLDEDAPIYGLYSGGGFLNMSGFERDQLLGQHFGHSMLGYRFRLAETGLLPAYAGMTIEYGNAAQKRSAVYGDGVLNGSFYLGYDSPLGPLYLGFGWSEESSGLLFLRLGTLFGAQSIGRR
ncbi:MAG: BamA/TamA family outer membrane protein [Xanthomonadales bacterium]|nr:BamA/TamA family outer membrane protein [Xanthomonadales bacterium]